MKKAIIISLAVSAVLLQGCLMDCVSPSTNVTTETRAVPVFTGIKLLGSGTVVLHSGAPAPLTIRCNENIFPYLKTVVEGSTLVISFDKCVTGRTTLEIDATIQELQLLELSGSGKIIGVDNLDGSSMDLNISGSGDIVANIEANNVDSRISGSGTITLAGRVNDHNIRISGSGDLVGFDLISADASASISGSGTCELNVSNDLEVHISGSGDVIYKGSPEIHSNISGSGTVRALPN
jgi:hypothetical protein